MKRTELERRKREAEERNKLRAKRTDEQQLARLDAGGFKATRERKKLQERKRLQETLKRWEKVRGI